jgi:nucleoside-diphosphate-sugar epimerase
MLICGASGFIGKNLLNYFTGKYNIRAVDIDAPHPASPRHLLDKGNDIEWVCADLRRPEDVKNVLKDVDIVLHYAATTTGIADIVSKPYIHVTDNAVMTSLLLREAFEQGIEHFVMPSCTLMYQSSDMPVKETDFNESDGILPRYFGAGNTKVYLEKMCEFFAGLGRAKHTVLRQSNIYGPYDKYDLKKGHVFGATVVKVMEAENEIVVWGTGEEERDLLHVSDLVACVEAALEKQEARYELVNVGLGESISVSNLVQSIVTASGKDLQIKYDETKPTIKTKLAVDITKVKEVLEWRPQISLDSGIKNTLSWYKENKTC